MIYYVSSGTLNPIHTHSLEIGSQVYSGPKDIKLANAGIASGGLKWQYIVNCHIF